MRILKEGKDKVSAPCIEFDDGTVKPIDEVLFDLIKTLKDKKVI